MRKKWRELCSYLGDSIALSWKGAIIALLVAVGGFGVFLISVMRIGLYAWQYILAFLAFGLIFAILVALAGLVGALTRALPPKMTAVFQASFLFFIFVSLLTLRNFGWAMGAALVAAVLFTVLGISIRLFLIRGRGKMVPSITLLLVLGAIITTTLWLYSPGSQSPRSVPTTSSFRVTSAGLAVNPILPGPFTVYSLFYGGGTNPRRPEFGPGVEIITPVVDGTALLNKTPGWKRLVRTWYWGFDLDCLPLNARVWFPEGEGPFPLVLMVHGNHSMEDHSDPGYEYLGQHLASHGYIMASVDENFLNGSWTGNLDGENGLRAWLLLRHLQEWQRFNETTDNPFYQRVDLENIALIGHSRGGEAVAIAAAMNRLPLNPDNTALDWDFGFSIQTVIAIAPTDGQYLIANKAVVLEDMNYLALQGSYDSDVYSFMGQSQFERVRFTGGKPGYKAAIYVDGANHGQFNTVWGRTDILPPFGWLLNTAPILPAEVQQGLAKAYITAFLDLTLRGSLENRSLFQSQTMINDYLPEVAVIGEYRDWLTRPVTTFEEDADVTTTTILGGSISGSNLAVWREQTFKPSIKVPTERSVVKLGWEGADGVYEITLPADSCKDLLLTEDGYLYISLADSKAEQEYPPDFSVVLQSGVEVAFVGAADYGPISARFRRQLVKSSLLNKTHYDSDYETITQTLIFPLVDFLQANPRLHLGNIEKIVLRFDRAPSGQIIVAEVGFGRL